MFFGCLDSIKALNPGETTPAGIGWQPKPGAGIVLGEGAGALVLERRKEALARNASVYAAFSSGVITGGLADIGRYDQCDQALLRAINQALDIAGKGLPQIDQFSVSANFSGDLEGVEARALKQVRGFGRQSLQVTPLRYLSGSFGGAGILSAAALALSLKRSQSLPTLPLDILEHGLALPSWQTGQGQPHTALLTACSFGGGCAALVFSQADSGRI
jgi:3-oxoacyl-[acyl-carrier-protein] synthase II